MMLGGLALAILLQASQTSPVLAFPEPGLDDSSAYQGYQTRFYRDSRKNVLQIYLQPRSGRVVHLWADAANESIGFTVRDPAGRALRSTWGGESATVSDSGNNRSLEYRLTTAGPRVELGWFVLGSMRIERDFQYAERHLRPYRGPPFLVAEESLLVARVSRLPEAERRRHLDILRAESLEQLRARLRPSIALARSGGGWTVRIERLSLDGRNRLALELRSGPGDSVSRPTPQTVAIRSRGGRPVQLVVRVTTDAAALTPLGRREIFNRDFFDYLAAASRARDSAGVLRYRRLERQVRGVELLSTREKLMAGLPNFATYFGRDMMMTALMMRPVWTPEMSEHVIASVLGKLAPDGSVSHEEALGGQAIREHAVVYDSLLEVPSLAALAQARELLGKLQQTRENYHMIDDEYQLPVLAGRYLADSAVPAERKRAFLLDSTDRGESHLAGLIREMALVVQQTRPYAEDPRAINLVSFPKRDSVHWRSASWRDSDAGYAGGRFAMDVNAIWAPHALEAIAKIATVLPTLGFSAGALDSLMPELESSRLGGYLRHPGSLRRVIDIWRGARRHFEVRLPPDEIGRRVEARLGWLPEEERRYWRKVMSDAGEPKDTLTFLAIALDQDGRPIPVLNTDPATGLFLENRPAEGFAAREQPGEVLRDIDPFVRPYPVGLFAPGLGPLVANDAYASRDIWERFRKDPYHGPRVVWGREVNLIRLGLANQIAGRDLDGLNADLQQISDAVHASGLEHNELWSYRIENGRLRPTRYGSTSDIQLWNSTNLAVQFALSRVPPD